jgi:hypothetical protein
MRELNLNDKEIIYNNGADLWDYMFENQRLPKVWVETNDNQTEDDDWYDEGLLWLQDELLDGEIFSVFEDYEIYAYTSLGRHANLKKKNFKAMTLQGNTIAGNITGGAFSMSRMVKEKWNITLDYTKLPYECTKHIKTTNASKHLKEWIKQNG